MASLKCPNGHNAVIRHDPESTGMVAQCDMCGWSAPFAVVRERARYEADEEREIGHNDDPQRRELPPPREESRPRAEQRRRGEQAEREHS